MFRKSKTLFLAACILSSTCAPLLAVNEDAGTIGFAALKTVYSARAVALGQALTGEAKNPDGVHFNPAAILGIDGNEIASTYANSFIGGQGGQLQFLWPKNRFTAWGFALRYMNAGSFERTGIDPFGELIETGETFGAFNVTASASLAKRVSDAIDAGGTLKVILDQIDSSSASAVLLDLGLVHHPVNDRVQVGLSIRNLGLQTSYYTENKYKEKLPTTYVAGLSYRITPQLLGIVEVGKASGENVAAKLGMEYALNPALDLRAGFRSNAAEGYNGGTFSFLSGFSLGAGWSWRNYTVDYGVASYGDLGLLNQLSLKYEF